MCLAQFAANYTYNRGNENCIGEDESEFVHELDSDILMSQSNEKEKKKGSNTLAQLQH